MITITTANELHSYSYSHMMCTWEYITVCSVPSVTLKRQFLRELLYCAIPGTDLHLTEDYTIAIYIRWLIVKVNVSAAILPPSTPI